MRNIIYISWGAGAAIATVLMALHFLKKANYHDLSYKWIFLLLDTSLVVLTIAVYSYFYGKSRQAQIIMRKHSSVGAMLPRGKINFFNGKFLVPISIVLTFVVFMYIPDIVYAVILQQSNVQSECLRIGNILYSVGMSLDAIICLGLNKVVRIRFLKTICPGHYNRKVRPTLAHLQCGNARLSMIEMTSITQCVSSSVSTPSVLSPVGSALHSPVGSALHSAVGSVLNSPVESALHSPAESPSPFSSPKHLRVSSGASKDSYGQREKIKLTHLTPDMSPEMFLGHFAQNQTSRSKRSSRITAAIGEIKAQEQGYIQSKEQ